MESYDYANARLHGMRSRLLNHAQLSRLAESGSVDGLIRALTHTPYRESITQSMAQLDGLDCINRALHQHLIDLIETIRKMYPDKGCLQVYLGRYDLHNIKTILRGVQSPLNTEEITSILIPAGNIPVSVLKQVLTETSVWGVVDRLISLNIDLALPLLKLRRDTSETNLTQIEHCLEQTYFAQAMTHSKCEASVRIEADLINLITVVRLITHRINPDTVDSLWVGPGELRYPRLKRAALLPDIRSLPEFFEDSPYRDSIRLGTLAYQANNSRLSAFEYALNQGFRRQRVRQIARDPLGQGVLDGYLALKETEIEAIHWIARGLRLHLSADTIMSALEVQW